MGDQVTTLDLLIKALAAAVPATALIFAAKQYTIAQRWKKHEFVSPVWKEIESNPAIVKTMTMLDWNDRYITLFEGEDDQRVTDGLLVQALIPHTETDKKEFTYIESAIRDYFDEFFDALVRINHFIDAGLFTAEDARIYVEYWLKILTGEVSGKSEKTREALWKFIEAYKYYGVRELCKKLALRTPGVPKIENMNEEAVRRTRKQDRGLVIKTRREKVLGSR